MFGKKKKIRSMLFCLAAAFLLWCGLCGGPERCMEIGESLTAYAAEETLTENDTMLNEETAEGTETAGTQIEIKPFTDGDKFRFFLCCLFAVVLCIAVAIWGNPNDRLKDKYKRARKRQAQEEKRKRELEARAARRAEEDARYAEEVAKYEADMKALEEEKAAKKAAKAAKKAEKSNRKSME